MIVPVILPTFLRPSFYSSKKVAASKNTTLHRQKEALDGKSRFSFVVGSDNEVQERYDYKETIQRTKNCLAMIWKQQQEVVPPAEVQDAEISRVTYHDGNLAIEVTTPPVSSFTRELRPGPAQRVRFIDETFGLTPLHIVTDTFYRPKTVEEEKPLLYYSPEDYARFALEDWEEKLSKEIKRLEKLQVKKSRDKEDTKDTISRVRRHHNLCVTTS
jgi:hypothetical protein